MKKGVENRGEKREDRDRKRGQEKRESVPLEYLNSGEGSRNN